LLENNSPVRDVAAGMVLGRPLIRMVVIRSVVTVNTVITVITVFTAVTVIVTVARMVMAGIMSVLTARGRARFQQRQPDPGIVAAPAGGTHRLTAFASGQRTGSSGSVAGEPRTDGGGR
jgi:hypothetical protein